MDKYDRDYALRLIDACERSQAIDPPEMMQSFPLDRVLDMVNHIDAQAARITRLEDAMRKADELITFIPLEYVVQACRILRTALEGE